MAEAAVLRSTLYRNATLDVVRRTELSLDHGMIGWSEDGAVLGDVLVRRGGWELYHSPPVAAARHEERPSIYGGVLCRNFGHFLTETLARYWAIRRSERRVVWVLEADARGLRPWQREIMALMGLDSAVPGLLEEPTRFADLEVPGAGLALNLHCDAGHARAMGVVPFRSPSPDHRVWLSRSRLNEHKARVVNEAELEALLAADGWHILHPEAIPVATQLDALADAAIIAGFDGSAFHTILLGDAVRARLIILPRGMKQGVKRTFDMIAAGKGVSQQVLPADLVHVLGSARGGMHTRIGDVADLRRRLDDACRRPAHG